MVENSAELSIPLLDKLVESAKDKFLYTEINISESKRLGYVLYYNLGDASDDAVLECGIPVIEVATNLLKETKLSMEDIDFDPDTGCESWDELFLKISYRIIFTETMKRYPYLMEEEHRRDEKSGENWENRKKY